MPRKDSLPASASTAQAQQEAISDGIENYELPKTLVTRIAKSSVHFMLEDTQSGEVNKDVHLYLDS